MDDLYLQNIDGSTAKVEITGDNCFTVDTPVDIGQFEAIKLRDYLIDWLGTPLEGAFAPCNDHIESSRINHTGLTQSESDIPG